MKKIGIALTLGTFFLMAGYLMVFVGCGDINQAVSSIIINPTPVTIGISQAQNFVAMGKNSLGTLLTVTPTWAVQGSIGSISTNGLFIAGTLEGSGLVLATVGSVTGEAVVTITANGWLQGVVTDVQGKQVYGIQVYLKERPTLFCVTSSNGSYSIGSIPAGKYRASINATTYYIAASQEVTVGRGAIASWSPVLQLQPDIPTIPTTTLPPW